MSWSLLSLSSVAKALEHMSLPGCFPEELLFVGRVACFHQGVVSLPQYAFTIYVFPTKAMWDRSVRCPYSRPSPHPAHINPLSYLPQVQWLTPWWWWLSNVSQIGLFTCRLNHSFRILVDAIYGQQASGRVGPEPRTTLQPTSKVYLTLLFSSQAWEVALSSAHSFLHSLSYRKGRFMKDRRLYFQWHHQIPFS